MPLYGDQKFRFDETTDVLGHELEIQPGETLTLAARAVTGTATYVIGSVNTREDQ